MELTVPTSIDERVRLAVEQLADAAAASRMPVELMSDVVATLLATYDAYQQVELDRDLLRDVIDARGGLPTPVAAREIMGDAA